MNAIAHLPAQHRPIESPRVKWSWMPMMCALAVLAAAAPIAWLIEKVHATVAGPEKAVSLIAVVLATLSVAPAALYFLKVRRRVIPGKVGIIAITSAAVVLVGVYLCSVMPYVLFPADFLIWSESDFVNDILKYRTGYPLFTPEVNNESFNYLPGSQLLTYSLAWLIGQPTSIPAYRMIQLGIVLLTALVGLACCRAIAELHGTSRYRGNQTTWAMLWLPILVLLATNSITNPYVHNLHNDALAQLVSVAAYWFLIRYATTRSAWLLALMAIMPAAGFLVKQSLLIWAALFGGYLLFFDQPRSPSRIVAFAVAGAVGILATIGGCFLMWGGDFWYWTITVLKAHGVSPLRSFEHLLDAWAFFAAGLIGGIVLLRGRRFDQMFGLWIIAMTYFSVVTYTSGVAYMKNHIGPGSLLTGIWLLAALPSIWPKLDSTRIGWHHRRAFVRAGLFTGLLGIAFAGLGVVRVPTRPALADATRYVQEIEREFVGQPSKTVLLDMGTWVYLHDGIVMKDRAPCIGERGFSQTGDFSGMIDRLNKKHYAKILVRKLHEPDCWYEYASWRRPSGIKKAMLDNYSEIGVIKAVGGDTRYGFGTISVLAPRS